MMRSVRLEETSRDVDPKFLGERPHRQHCRVRVDRFGAREQVLVLDAAEIMSLEQFRREDDLRAFAGRLADEVRHGGDIGVDGIGEGELERGDFELGHALYLDALGSCCEMQWKLPPPVRMCAVGRPTVRLPGKSAATAASAASSFGAPCTGTTTAALPM